MQCRNENGHKQRHTGTYNGNQRKKEMEMSYLGVEKKEDLWAPQAVATLRGDWLLTTAAFSRLKTETPTAAAPTNRGREEQTKGDSSSSWRSSKLHPWHQLSERRNERGDKEGSPKLHPAAFSR